MGTINEFTARQTPETLKTKKLTAVRKPAKSTPKKKRKPQAKGKSGVKSPTPKSPKPDNA